MGKMPSSGGSYVRHDDGDLERVEEPSTACASAVIETLKSRFGVSSDLELANALSVGRSTIANWRRRDRVPERYATLVDENTQKRLKAAFDYEMLSGEERAALCLALMRMHTGGFLTQLDSYPEFLRRGGFIPAQLVKNMEVALLDLLSKMEKEGYEDPSQCLNAMVFEELFSR